MHTQNNTKHLRTTPARFKVGQMIGSFGIFDGYGGSYLLYVDDDKKHQYKGMLTATALATWTGNRFTEWYVLMLQLLHLHYLRICARCRLAMADIVHLRVHSYLVLSNSDTYTTRY